MPQHSELRARLIVGASESLLFDTVLTWCRDRQLVKAKGHQRTDSLHILAAERALNRIEIVGETMRRVLNTLRRVLNTLAVVAPEWLRTGSPQDGRGCYARRAGIEGTISRGTRRIHHGAPAPSASCGSIATCPDWYTLSSLRPTIVRGLRKRHDAMLLVDNPAGDTLRVYA